MLVYSDHLKHVPILSLQTGAPLAKTERMIIDPRQLSIVAFYCEGPRLEKDQQILHVSDIREITDLGMIVDSNDVIMPAEGLVRLQEIISFNFELVGRHVVDDHGRKVGRVRDYITDLDSFYIQKLVVKQPVIKRLNETDAMIDRQQIVEINDQHIIVKSPDIKAVEPETVVQAIANPFRKAPQPDN